MDDLIDFTENKVVPSVSKIINNNSDREDIKLDAPIDDYQLDKNAMLLFCDHGAWVEDITRTFQKYRFVIDKYVNLTSEEIEEKCSSFFSRNFFEYGAVAVVIIESEMEYSDGPGMLQACDKSYHESVILKYFTTHVPVSLNGKPKIYVTQNTSVSYRIAIDDYEDILALHVPFETNYRDNLISKLCKNMEAFGENGDLLQIVNYTIRNEDAQKIKAICDFIGPEYANLLHPFFSDTPSKNPKKCSSNAVEGIQEMPRLSCTLKKRLTLPADIYFRLSTNQPVLLVPSDMQSTTEMGNFYC